MAFFQISNQIRSSICALLLFSGLTLASESPDVNQLSVKVIRSNLEFHVEASYIAQLNACNAYAFITDYGNAKEISGIKESKVLSRKGSVVYVERVVEETVLGFPIEMHSIERYIEESTKHITFEQIEGDTKLYKGSWTLEPQDKGTKFFYTSDIILDTLIPNFVVAYFLNHDIKARFAQMASVANTKVTNPYLQCLEKR
jgi:Polyketide cyclase / dehydrase and lipid transport